MGFQGSVLGVGSLEFARPREEEGLHHEECSTFLERTIRNVLRVGCQPRGGLVPTEKLVQRFEAFGRGEWASLIEASAMRKRRCHEGGGVGGFDEFERLAARAQMLVG